jgi:methyl-accepting chemotaxis protein-1 (serine sensor receptor)
MTAEESGLVEQAEAAMKAFNTEVTTNVLTALASKDTARLQEVVRDRMPALYQALRKPINDLIQLQLKVADSNYEQSVARYKVFLGVAITTLEAGLALGAGIAAWLIRSVTRPINHAVDIAESVAAGDLTHTVHIEASAETARLLNALKDMQSRLTSIVSDVRAGTDSINTASREIAVGNNDLSARAEDQAASLEETASSM